jgi:hypothetical protein
MNTAYCPNCGEPLVLKAITIARDRIYYPCKTNNAHCCKTGITTDKSGYIITPESIKGWYVHSRVVSETNKR